MPGGGVFGRERERETVEQLLAGARSGQSAALMLHGEPGVGKSTLLGYAADAARDMRVLRCAGVATEMDLAFAGLHQLLQPVLDLADQLPVRQRQALDAGLGLSVRGGTDRFLIAAAVLTLVSEAAAKFPVLCLVDDAQWLDRASTDALAFVARRLTAEGVVLLAASRAEPWSGLPACRIDGLDRVAATALLRYQAASLPDDVRDRLIERTAGNPLALVELANSVSTEQITGSGPLPLTEQVQRAFSDQVRALPEMTRQLLLVAAAENSGDSAVIFQAAQELGVPAGAVAEAERAGLVYLDGTGVLTFRHPLVRAAVYHGADLTDRLSVHRALASALPEEVDRRAWHLAASTPTPDENVATELELVAEKARHRGGHGPASAALERAAQLSPELSSRATRLSSAAQAAYDGGQLGRAAKLAERAAQLTDDLIEQARVTALRGTIELMSGAPATAHALLTSAARLMADHDPTGAVPMLVDAARAAINTGNDRDMADTTAAFAALPLPAEHALSALVTAHIGFGELYAGQVAAGLASIRQGIDTLLHESHAGQRGQLENVLIVGQVALAAGDDVAGLALAARLVGECRTRGLTGRLPHALALQAQAQALAGHHVAARVSATEALRLARDIGQESGICCEEGVLAWLAAVQGQSDRCGCRAADATRLAEERQSSLNADLTPWSAGLLDLSLGRADEALVRLLDCVCGPNSHPVNKILMVPDLVEAAARAGQPDRARDPLDRFAEWAPHTGQSWAQAVLHRCHALLADDDMDDETEAQFRQALRLHEDAGPRDRPFERARTQLLYGEWLRRTRRRAAARTHLSAAYEGFARLDATAWADRAAAELRATGLTVRRRENGDPHRLTPQELHIVRLAADGSSNKEIAERLFLSPRTVGYHLSNAFPKLGIASRRELAHLDLDAVTTSE